MQSLPTNRAPSLTEVMTWIITGECLTDEDIERTNRTRWDQYKARWGCGVRPDELGDFVSNLEAIVADQQPAVDEDFPGNQWVANQRTRWVTAINAGGKTLTDVLNEARDELRGCISVNERYDALFQNICAECRENRITLRGHTLETPKGSERLTLPVRYFDDPVQFCFGPSQWRSQTAIIPDTRVPLGDKLESQRRLQTGKISEDEQRKVYIDVVMSTEDAERILSKFVGGVEGGVARAASTAVQPASRKMRHSFQRIEAAIRAEEEATKNKLPSLRPGERNKRLADRMKLQGLKPAEIPKERTFREYFNNGPGKPAKSG